MQSDTKKSDLAIGSAADANSRYAYYMSFYASRSNAIYGNSSTVQPPSLTAIYAIKY